MKTLNMNAVELAKFQGQRAERIIIEKYLCAVTRDEWRDIAKTFISMPAPISSYAYPLLSQWDFYIAPGSGAHHTHFGGLALHTLQNLEYAEKWADLYEERGLDVDRSLLYATIIIHDSMKRFIYRFDEEFNLERSEDPFIAKREDHHSWVLRELTQRGCDKDLLLSVATIHGIDDVSLLEGVKSAAIVNHYLIIGDTGWTFSADDIRPEHVIAFLSDSDWHWSGHAQRKTGILAQQMTFGTEMSPNNLKVYLGSQFSYERVGRYIEVHGYDNAADYFGKHI